MTDKGQDKCVICGKEARGFQDGYDHTHRSKSFECPRCGTFRVLASAQRELEALEDELRQEFYLLSAITRRYWHRHRQPFEVNVHFKDLIRAQPRMRVGEKLTKLLREIAERSRHPGDGVELSSETDYPLALCRNEEEIVFYLTELSEAGLIRLDPPVQMVTAEATVATPWRATLTAKGWASVQEGPPDLASRTKAFVAMSFSEEMGSAYEEAIAPAVRAAGYEAVRMDQVEHVDIIDDRMVAEIKESRFLVAEFTGHRHGVYFEAGLALGLGLPVIWVCREDEITRAHFDTSHFNHIVWRAPADLREKLEARIKAIVGLGPGAAPAEAATAPDQS